MLSFDSSIRKSAETISIFSRQLKIKKKLDSIPTFDKTFSGLFCFILFQNTLRALKMQTASPWATFRGQFRKIKTKKFCPIFFFFHFQNFYLFFQWPLLLHPLQKHFQGADIVDGAPLGTFFWAISKNQIKKICLIFFSLFFRFFLNLVF